MNGNDSKKAAASAETSAAAASLKNKHCSVCGDKALGYNFNALTCESCKAFFRRNALKNKEFKCPFSNECEVTLITRRFCQKCRLKKCFDIGMKKEWILSDEEKIQKRQKIEENRAKKRSPSATSTTNPLSPSQIIQDDDDDEDDDDDVKPDIAAAAAVLLDLHPSNSLASSSLDRPQARVLPSTRSSSADGGAGIVTDGAEQPRRPPKHGRYSDSLSPSLSSPSSRSNSLPPTPGYSNNNSTSSLIKQELLLTTTTTSQEFVSVPQQQQQQQYGISLEGQQEAVDFTLNDNSNIGGGSSNGASMMQYLEDVGGGGGGSHSSGHYFGGECGSGKPCGSGASFSTTMNGFSHNIPDFSQSHNLDEIVAVAIEAEFHVQTTQFQAGRDRDFNDQEQARMHELFLASRALVEPLDLEKTPLSAAEPNNLISVINLTDLAIKRIIRMAKKITPFINMCQEDQIALLKGGCTELMILRSVINYNPDKNSWRLPSKDHPRELSMELLKEASQLGVNLYEEHQRFVKSFDPQWRTDENVMLLLSAIALFTPTRVNVMHQDVVKYEQDTYYYLLRRYLETVCRDCEPRRAYLHLIGRLQDLHRLNESHIQLFLEVNPKLVEPLLIEIFDLNP